MHQSFRERIFDQIEDGVLILKAGKELLRNNDTEYSFRQESAFWYLTGLDEPDAIVVLTKSGGRKRFVLFVRPRDAKMEMWTGRRMGPAGAKKLLGAHQAYSLDEFDAQLEGLLKGHARLYLPLDNSALQHKVLAKLNTLQMRRKLPGVLPSTIQDCRRLVAEQRLRKSPDEIAMMERAAAITAEAFGEVFRHTKPGVKEHQLQAMFPFIYGLHGGNWSFESIVATGENACILHYVSCRDTLKDGDLVLFDAGAEKGFYAADVSRTVPVNGTFNRNQLKVYNMVLKSLKDAIAEVRPGVSVDHIHKTAACSILDSLLAAGLLKGKRETLIAKEAWRRWFPHGTSHWLGLDVHDVGDYAGDHDHLLLEEGMVITVEPGLYFPPDDKKVPEALRGIGVRIEDDVLVTAKGHRVLTAAIPKEAADIEKAMRGKPRYVRALPKLNERRK
jgi:Xaa-Pro aminopeptidase